MKTTELLSLKPDIIVYDKYNIGFSCTVKECSIIMIKAQIIGGEGADWAERFQLENPQEKEKN